MDNANKLLEAHYGRPYLQPRPAWVEALGTRFRNEGERLARQGQKPLSEQAYDAGRDVPVYGPLQDATYASQWEGKPLASWEVGGKLGQAALEGTFAGPLANGIRPSAAWIARGIAARDLYNTWGWTAEQSAKHALQRLGFAGAASYPLHAAHDALSDKAPAEAEKPFDLEKAVTDHLAREKWGPDMPWYLRETMIGDAPYRYQGVALHSGIAALPGMPLWARLANLGYVGYSLGTGRTQRPRIEDMDFPADATDVSRP